MVSPHLQIPDITAGQNQKEVTNNDQVTDLDDAMNKNSVQKTISGNSTLTQAEHRESHLLDLIGSPASDFTLDFFDANQRTMAFRNSTGKNCTIRNSAGGGTTFVLADGEVAEIYYTGTNVYGTRGAAASQPAPQATERGTWVQVSRQVVSSVASVSIFWDPALYDTIEIQLIDLVPASEGTLIARLSIDGTTFESGASDYETVRTKHTGSSNSTGSVTASSIQPATGLGNVLPGFYGFVRAGALDGTGSRKPFIFSMGYEEGIAVDAPTRQEAVGYYHAGNNAIQGIQFLMGAGNISGTFVLMGQLKSAPPFEGVENFVTNGEFKIAQRGTSFTAATTPANNDDTYLLDQVILLSDGNDIVDVSQETTTVPDGATASLKSLVATANAKWGFLFPLTAERSKRLIGNNVSLGFRARTTTGAVVNNIRAAILSWTSTADAITSDVVSAWGAQGVNPTFATNWTAENTAANLALVADTWTDFTINAVNVAAGSAANVAVFIWVDDTDAAANDELFIADVLLELGDASHISLSYPRKRFQDELTDCQQFFFKTYNYVDAPGTVTGVGAIHGATPLSSTNLSNLETSFPVSMFQTPVVTWYSPSTGTSARVRNRTSGADVTINSTLDAGQKNSGIPIAASAVASGQRIAAHVRAEALL